VVVSAPNRNVGQQKKKRRSAAPGRVEGYTARGKGERQDTTGLRLFTSGEDYSREEGIEWAAA
jgi:hypothetical protein